MEQCLRTIHAWVWSPFLIGLIIVLGIYFTWTLRGLQFRLLKHAFMLAFTPKESLEKGSISPLQALLTSLAGIVGVGNIAGVATALTIGGVGAVVWMWVSGFLGMALSFSENCLSLRTRKNLPNGEVVGGPMYYIRSMGGPVGRVLAILFAIACLGSSFGLGNLVQAQSLSEGLYTLFALPQYVTGMGLAIAVGIVLIGGIKRLGVVASFLVPLMGALYCLCGLAIVFFYWKGIPHAFYLIFQEAFSPYAVAGGVAGTILSSVRVGMARGIFSNEAGLGSAPIASAQAQAPSAAFQGLVSMIGTFLSTCVVCTMTALVIILTGVLDTHPNLTGASLTIAAFNTKLFFGGWAVGLALLLFGYTTSLGWAYYGECSLRFLIGPKALKPFRVIFCASLLLGSISSLDMVWLYADIANGLMVYPNLIALLYFSRDIQKELMRYWNLKRA